MSRRDILAALLAEHRYEGTSTSVTCSCGWAWRQAYPGMGDLGFAASAAAHVADVIDRALDQDDERRHVCGRGCGACADHDPRDRRDHGHLPTSMCHACQTEPRQDEDAPESCGERHPTNPTALACCLDRGHVEDHYSTTECPGSVVRWPRHSHPIDEPRQDEGGDREVLAARRDTLIEAISWLEDLAAEVSDD